MHKKVGAWGQRQSRLHSNGEVVDTSFHIDGMKMDGYLSAQDIDSMVITS